MSADLTPLDSEPPTDDVIEKLEGLLEVAREGRISSVAIAVVYRDGTTGDSWSKAHNIGTLIGSVSVLWHRLCRLIDKD